MARRAWEVLVLAIVGLLLFIACLVTGSVDIPMPAALSALFAGEARDAAWVTIVRQVRLPEAATAALAGAGLAASGLMMQTLFRNPLAGPGVLGISSGASLGVAVMLLARPAWAAFLSDEAAAMGAAWVGAFAVLALIMLCDRRVGGGTTLLIIGLMAGYLCGALISVLQAASPAAMLKGFVLWGMGSFAAVTTDRMPWLALPVAVGLVGAVLLVKPLNAWLPGEEHAASVGVNVGGTRRLIVLVTGLLAGSITAFCGPVAFLGLATPHIARAFIRTGDHRRLMTATILMGVVLALFCDLLVRGNGPGHALPLNAITSLLGAPVVLWVLLAGRRWARST